MSNYNYYAYYRILLLNFRDTLNYKNKYEKFIDGSIIKIWNYLFMTNEELYDKL